jgi:hypothetical protein
MEAASAPGALLPLLAAPPRFLNLPLRRLSTRRHGCGSGFLLQPPPLGPGSRARCRTTCCASGPDYADVLLGGASLCSVAAVTLLAALQLVWLRWRSATHGDSPEVSVNSGHFVDIAAFLRSPWLSVTYLHLPDNRVSNFVFRFSRILLIEHCNLADFT